MSTNCIRCVVNKRDNFDLLCSSCRTCAVCGNKKDCIYILCLDCTERIMNNDNYITRDDCFVCEYGWDETPTCKPGPLVLGPDNNKYCLACICRIQSCYSDAHFTYNVVDALRNTNKEA